MSFRSPFCSRCVRRGQPDRQFDPLVRERRELLEKQLVGMMAALLPFIFATEFVNSTKPQWVEFLKSHSIANKRPCNKIYRTVQAVLRKAWNMEHLDGCKVSYDTMLTYYYHIVNKHFILLLSDTSLSYYYHIVLGISYAIILADHIILISYCSRFIILFPYSSQGIMLLSHYYHCCKLSKSLYLLVGCISEY